MHKTWMSMALGTLLLTAGCGGNPLVSGAHRPSGNYPASSRVPVSGVAAKIVGGAKAQLIAPAQYTGEYFSIPYPNGDIPAHKGACVDVVIRALRPAGYDLQELVHNDIKSHLSSYPRHGDRPDPNIDHRRVPNLRYFFSRFGRSLSTRIDAEFAGAWRPGDIVTWKIGNLDHTGVISDGVDEKGLPLVIHNIGETAEQDVLTQWPIDGHYRFPK